MRTFMVRFIYLINIVSSKVLRYFQGVDVNIKDNL